MPEEVETATSVPQRSRTRVASKAFWYGVWWGLALVAIVCNFVELTSSAREMILAGHCGLLLGGLLIAAAAMQLASGVPFLSHKEAVLSSLFLVLFGFAQLDGSLMSGNLAPRRYDFGAYYVAGKLAAEHPPARMYYQAVYPDGRISTLGAAEGWREVSRHYGVSQALTFVYPPFFAACMRPFAYFSYDTAYGLWSAFTVVLTILSVLICLDLGGQRLSLKLGLIFTVGLFSYAPFFQELVLGQVASLILFLCALGVWLLTRERNWSSAFCFAFATMIKITPAIAIPLLIMYRKWKWLTAYACWMVVLTGFSIWQVGWPAHEEFLHGVMPSVSCGIVWILNISLVNWIQEIALGFVPTNLTQATLPAWACTVSKVVALVVFCAAMVRFYLNRREENIVLHLSLLLLLSLAISPITWAHHYMIALLPFLYLWCRLKESEKDKLLLATFLTVGTTVVLFILPFSLERVRLLVVGIVPCLTVCLVWFRIVGEERPQISLDKTF